MRQFEHFQAVALMNWWAYESIRRGVHPQLLFAIPNGGARHIAVAGKLKAEGVRAGCPDYMLAVPAGGFHGLFLELKTEDGRPTKEQKHFLGLLTARGYMAVVAYGTEDAINQITAYLKLGQTVTTPKLNNAA